MIANPYTTDFYTALQVGTRSSAEAIVPLVLEMTQPKRIVDVGCGTGEWLYIFQKYGIEHVLGIDGEWVERGLLQIPEDKFLAVDLRRPIMIEDRFDLVISLEVAEHLPLESAECFVESLTRLGDIILFSAAIPFQGGTAHINEQWPTYWAAHFEKMGYVAIDCIRNRIWNSQTVNFWYAQNMMIYVLASRLRDFPLLEKASEKNNSRPPSLVHPSLYQLKIAMATILRRRAEDAEHALQETQSALQKAELDLLKAQPINLPLRTLLSVLPRVATRAFKRRLKTVLRLK